MTTPTDAGSAELVEELRTFAFDDCDGRDIPTHIGNQAADRILALETRIRELEEALRKIAATTETAETDDGEIGVSTELDEWEMSNVARAALKAQEQG